MFGFGLSEAASQQHREAYFITLMFLWALKFFYQVLDKVSLVYYILVLSSILLTPLLSVLSSDCQHFTQYPQMMPDVLISALFDLNTLLQLISEATNLTIRKWYSDIPAPGHISPGHPWSMQIWATLIASRINSSDIILEFQITAGRPRLARHDKV